jgi:hypothetical protein
MCYPLVYAQVSVHISSSCACYTSYTSHTPYSSSISGEQTNWCSSNLIPVHIALHQIKYTCDLTVENCHQIDLSLRDLQTFFRIHINDVLHLRLPGICDVFCIVTKLQVGRSGVRIPAGAGTFSLIQEVQKFPEARPPSCLMVMEICSWGKGFRAWSLTLTSA